MYFFWETRRVVEILSSSDLFIMPSQSKVLGLRHLKLWLGITCNKYFSRRITELNVHNETGFICEIGDLKNGKILIDLLRNDKEI
jgi:hypothetical protein